MLTVKLIEMDDAVAQALGASPGRFESACGISLGRNAGLVRDAVQQTLAMLSAAPRPAPWVGYLAVDEPNKIVVGTCAFKTGPDQDGAVEIAYFTFPSFEGRGVATAMARRLLEMARASQEVREVIAHTLPERNASTRVLEKIGMCHVGEVIDPEDGPVWRWRLGFASPGRV